MALPAAGKDGEDEKDDGRRRMKMMFAVGRVTRESTRVIVARRPAGTPAPDPACAGGEGPAPAPAAEPGDFRARQASPDTIH